MSMTPPASSANTPTHGARSPSDNSAGMDLDVDAPAPAAAAVAAAPTVDSPTPAPVSAAAAASGSASGSGSGSAGGSGSGSAAPASPQSDGEIRDAIEVDEELPADVSRATGSSRKEQMYDAAHVERWNKDLGDLFIKA